MVVDVQVIIKSMCGVTPEARRHWSPNAAAGKVGKSLLLLAPAVTEASFNGRSDEVNTKNQEQYGSTTLHLLRRNKLEAGRDFRLCSHKICEVRNHQRVLQIRA